jgi:hypothetical protein
MLPDPSLVSIVIEGGHNLDIGLNLTPFLRIADQLEKHSEIIARI